jgi:hypothetical protein
MHLGPLQRAWRRAYRRLREGHVLRLGPVAVVRARLLDNLLLRLGDAERRLIRSGRAGALPLAAPVPRLSNQSPRDVAKRRSIVFLHQSYYNFFYLAAALRRRGWDAVSASIDDPNGANAIYYHGEDVNLFDADAERYNRNLVEFCAEVEERFRMVHFYGVGSMSIFPALFDTRRTFDALPSDFLRMRHLGIKLGYSVSGCLDGVAQSSVRAWSGACDRCVWQNQPHVCADQANLAWGHKVHMMCDLVATEGFPALDWQGESAKVFRDPLTTALDPDFWRPDLEIPEKYRLARAPGEMIVFHSVGNHALRARNGRDLKGTGATVAAIERLRGEGVPVRLEFVTNVPNKEVRFIQAQADIVVDQLNYGRYGAQAREGMMLGKPTVCYINRDEPPEAERLESIETCPLVTANEQTVYAVLKDLLGDTAKRQAIGDASRKFALRWHAADACAARFETVYDRLMSGLPPMAARTEAAAK